MSTRISNWITAGLTGALALGLAATIASPATAAVRDADADSIRAASSIAATGAVAREGAASYTSPSTASQQTRSFAVGDGVTVECAIQATNFQGTDTWFKLDKTDGQGWISRSFVNIDPADVDPCPDANRP